MSLIHSALGSWVTAGLPVLTDNVVQLPTGRSKRGSHHLAAYEQCERMGYLRYDQGYIPEKDKPFRMRGTLFHLSLAFHYAARMAPPPTWYQMTTLDAALDQVGAGWPEDIRKTRQFLSCYRREYVQEPWTPYMIEEELQTTIGEIDPGGPDSSLDHEVITCRADLVVLAIDPETREPVLWIIDYKSAGKNWDFVDGRWIMRGGLEPWKEDGDYLLNWQVLVNLHILRAPSNRLRLGGYPVKGFYIQRMTREPDGYGRFYFDRHLVTAPHMAYARAPRVAREAVRRERQVLENIKNGIAPNPSYWACYGKYGPCDYRDVCAARDVEQQNQILNDRFIKEAA